MQFEIAKIVLLLLSGGLAGAVATELFRRRSGRLQKIPLIERVNRRVVPGLRGITLARVNGSSFSEIKNLQEYQLTLKNTSTIHLQDVEIQFDFPGEDVQAFVSRTALSKTELQNIETTPTEPWKKAFRWRIPQFPSGDAAEFTFQSVDPPSDEYEAALYHSDRVVVERVLGEPIPRTVTNRRFLWFFPAVFLMGGGFYLLSSKTDQTLSNEFADAGCKLRITSSFQREIPFGSAPSPPSHVMHRFYNIGNQDCALQWDRLGSKGPLVMVPGQLIEREFFVESAKPVRIELSAGASAQSLKKTLVQIYVEQ